MMKVTYTLFNNNDIILEKCNYPCFFGTFSKNNTWDKMKLLYKVSIKNRGLKGFWFDFLKEIEPSLRRRGKFLYIPYLGSKGKTLFILTAIRYLWESSNNYDIIVRTAKKIKEQYPDIPNFEILALAASSTDKAGGWGHSILKCMADSPLSKQKDYDEFKSDKCTKLLNSSNYIKYIDELSELRKAKKNELDIEPVLKFYKYIK